MTAGCSGAGVCFVTHKEEALSEGKEIQLAGALKQKIYSQMATCIDTEKKRIKTVRETNSWRYFNQREDDTPNYATCVDGISLGNDLQELSNESRQ